MKRRERSWQNPWRVALNSDHGWVWFTLVAGPLLVAFFGTLLYLGVYQDQNRERAAQYEIIHVLEAADQGTLDRARTNVETVATSFVEAKRLGDDSLGLDDPRFVDALKSTTRTGSLPQPTIEAATWGPYWHFWFPLWTVLLYTLAWLSFGYCYVRETFERREYLADLRWSSHDTIAFVLIMAPPLWPAFMVSAVRMARNAERDAAEARKRAKAETQRRTRAKARDKEASVFEDDPVGALKLYGEIRSAGTMANITRKREELTQEIADLTEEGSQLGEQMRAIQQRRVVARAELGDLETIVVSVADVVDAEQIQIEFNRLVAFESVQRIRACADGVRLFVAARMTHEGVRYDLGDWDLRISRTGIEAYELRTGRKPGWRWSRSPSYRLSETRFCFGDRRRELNNHALQGQILEAASMAIECLRSVNEVDAERIPEAFNRIEDGAE